MCARKYEEVHQLYSLKPGQKQFFFLNPWRKGEKKCQRCQCHHTTEVLQILDFSYIHSFWNCILIIKLEDTFTPRGNVNINPNCREVKWGIILSPSSVSKDLKTSKHFHAWKEEFRISSTLEIGRPQIQFSLSNGRWLLLSYNSKRQKEGMGWFLKIISLALWQTL